MSEVRSSDGTAIGYEKVGEGPPLILVDGALCSRAMGPSPKVASALADHFTVYTYDRRGRGGSSDTPPYAVEREVEDLEALVDEAGGSAYVFGSSSGAALALDAATRSTRIAKLALYEAPFIVDDTRSPVPDDAVEQLEARVAAGRPGDAVKYFMKLTGAPAIFIALMRLMPAWKKLTAVAHTLPYDLRIVKDNQHGRPLPAHRWDAATTPTLVIAGGKSPAWMRNGQHALADVLPNAELRVLQGQTHMIKAKAVAPALVEFLQGSTAAAPREAPTGHPSPAAR